ncbi:two-component system chemotaxis sensor kinase CheA [Rhizomicrobium palustre]|uniref:Chemotaxis protein CheA n=1 Tax=Rhizomicrobium palustre TaxID=189966 RepID=A0A846N1L8_9PROT|nr:chemotaxis protein CheA [Rhizomicrobium palustre]NIK89636.1 two-component system chemotaxis sensor kinase CheA [Rhizomicrobium palustre]
MSHSDPQDIFRAESQELLEQLEQGLLDLENRPQDGEIVAKVFRALHTLKGSGAMFGYEALASFTHHLETAFDRVRKNEVPATPALIAAVLDALDHMRALARHPAAEADGGEELLNELRQAMALETAVPPTAPSQHAWRIYFSLPPDCLINGTRPLALLDELRALGDAKIVADTSGIPNLADLSPNQCHIAWTVELTTSEPRSVIEEVFLFVIDDMVLKIEELTAEEEPQAPIYNVEGAPVADSAPPQEPAAEKFETRITLAGETVRVPASRLDELLDQVGELMIAQSRLKQVANATTDSSLRSVAEEIERLASVLRDSMMFVRMVPISQLFGRFRRLIHDLARETGKEIEFSTDGGTTELDKTVIERLADPLIHLIRNAADHGLESTEERIAAGKPEKGQIHLSARQAGTEVVITVSDDGRGIDRARVKAKAEENHLIPPGAVLSDHDIYQLIFKPGFSTAAKISSLSGRGVGMDVVKRTIDSLRGTIELTSIPAAGSSVDLRLPLTLAIIEGLLVRVGEGRYVIPLSCVEECIELLPEQDQRSTGRSFITLRNSLVPFLRLREMFATGTDPDRYQKIVVISTGSERVGLVVDQIIGHHQTVIKPLSRFHAKAESFSGATILGDGCVALILDVMHLVALGQKQEGQLSAAV